MIAGEYPPAIGGVADYTALLVDALRADGCSVFVATTWEAPADSFWWPVQNWGWTGVLQLLDRIRTAAPDVIHVQYQTAAFGMSPLVNLLPTLLRLRGLRQPVVTTFHDRRPPYLFPKAGPLRRFAVRHLVRQSRAAIFVNPADLQGATKKAWWVPLAPSIIPPDPSPDRTPWRRRLGMQDTDVVVAFFGFLNASKGVPDLVRALALLAERRLPARLLLIGDATGTADATNAVAAREVQGLAEQVGVGGRITMTGHLAAPNVSAALLAADMCALPYSDGAAPNRSSLIAALAHGLPVITTTPAVVSQPEAVLVPPPFAAAGSVGRWRITEAVAELIPAHDPGALAAAIADLSANSGRRGALQAGARSYVRELTWQNVARATQHVYREALAQD